MQAGFRDAREEIEKGAHPGLHFLRGAPLDQALEPFDAAQPQRRSCRRRRARHLERRCKVAAARAAAHRPAFQQHIDGRL